MALFASFGSPVQVELMEPPDTYRVTVTIPNEQSHKLNDVLKIIAAGLAKQRDSTK